MASSSHSRQSPIANFFRRPTSHHHLDLLTHTPYDLEFQESDLYFNNYSSSSTYSSNASKIQNKVKSSRTSAKVADESRSAPLSILASWSTRVQSESEGSDEEDQNNTNCGKRVPPHEYLARKRGASLSVHEGVGRTLKGRDMSRVRNAVWKRIGFED